MSRSLLRLVVVFIVTLFLPSPGFPGTFVAFGPQNYARGTASPVVVSNAFTVLNPSTSYTLKIDNGGLVGGQFEKVSSAVISLNGVQIVGPNEFNQNVTLVERPITLAASNQLSVELRGKPGGGITIQIIGVDNDPPTIAASVNPAPNAAGWHKADATVSFTCSDATSGIASCPNPMSVSTEGANQVVSGTAVDRAGNTASTSVTLNIDKTPPTLSTTVTPQPNPAGWSNNDVTVSFTCSDSASGVASCPTPIAVSTEGANHLISGTATDLAGNSASTSVSISLDKTAPTVAITSPSSGATVSSSPVSVTGTVSDSLSGIATVLCNGNPATLSTSTFSCDVPLTNGPNTITVEATDIASNKRSSTITVTLGQPLEPQSPPVVFGPRIFTLPNEAVSFLVTNPVGTFWLQVENGHDGQNLVDSAVISINDTQVAGPTNFTPNPFGFQKDVTLQVGNTLEVELSGAAGSFITIEIREAKLNPGVPNTEGDLVGRNIGTSTYLGWVETEGATEYRVLKSTSVNGPWTEMGRSARTGADDISPEINTADLCYKIEALNDLAEVIRVYDPVCVPKFVEPQTQSFNLQRSLPAPENTITRTVIRDDPVRLASLNPLAIAATIYLLPERTAQAKNAEPNPGVPNSAGDLVGRNIGTSTYLGWVEAEGATEYRVFKSTSVNGLWVEMGRSARTGADDISPNVRTMDLCYKVEALDAMGNVIRSYEPICVPKFVEPQRRSLQPGNSLTILDSLGTSQTRRGPGYSLQLASLNLMADAPDPRINGLCFANPDPEFTDWKSRGVLDESGIRTFLKDHGSSLQFIVPDLDVGGKFDAALEIFNAAKNFQINPEVLLTLMEKEKPGSVTSPKLARDSLRLLMGWDPLHRVVPRDQKTARGQVQRAAKQLRSDFDTVAAGGQTLGGWKRDQQKLTVDDVFVTPSNNPATVLYAYDPYAGRQRGGNTAFGGNARFCEIWEEFGFKRDPVAISPQNPTLVCGPDASVTLTASGGRPGPNGYQWSVSNSNARVAVTGANKENMELRPPENTGSGVDGIAYDQHWQGKGKAFNNETCVDDGNSACCDSYKCDDSLNDPNGCPQHGWPGPWWTCIFIASDANRVNCIGLPQCFENTGLFATCKSRIDVSTGGVIHDVRTQAMKDAGCKPCAPEMQGVTVTVTDAAGASAPTTVGAQ